MSLSNINAEAAFISVFDKIGNSTKFKSKEVGLSAENGRYLSLTIDSGSHFTSSELLLVSEGHVGFISGCVPLQVTQHGCRLINLNNSY